MLNNKSKVRLGAVLAATTMAIAGGMIMNSMVSAHAQSAGASIKNLATGQCLEGDSSGAVFLSDCTGADAQKWSSAAADADGSLTFTNTALPDRVLFNNDVGVGLEAANGTLGQKWTFSNSELRNAVVGNCLDSALAFTQCNGSDSQKWDINA